MANPLLDAAIQYHNEGLCVIPIIEHDKRPALAEWEAYHTRCSTEQEIRQWWDSSHNYNVGVVHGEVSGNYIAIDLDHDNGLLDELFSEHSYLFAGRIEQSGSGEGYHIPLKLNSLPDFGLDQRRNRPRGNRTWKTKMGVCNIRARFCQTVCPPSIHPSGGLYKFVKSGEITRLSNLDGLITWLDKLAPPPVPAHLPPHRPITPTQGNDLVNEVKAAWPTVLGVFEHFTMASQQRQEPNGEIRLLGNGGLLLTPDLQTWYCFSDEMGGGVFEAWGYCRFGSSYDKRKHFRQVLLEMALAAGVDIAQFYRRGDEGAMGAPSSPNKTYWTQQYAQRWALRTAGAK